MTRPAEWIIACDCEGEERIQALFNSDKITVNDIPMMFKFPLECEKCKGRFKKYRDTDPEFNTLYKMRSLRYWGAAKLKMLENQPMREPIKPLTFD